MAELRRRYRSIGKEMPPALRKLVEAWIAVHEEELLEQWHRARSGEQVMIVG